MTVSKSFLILAAFLALGAQTTQEPEPQVTIRKQVDLVLVDLLLTDARGDTLKGLRSKDVELLDENAPQEIVHFSQDEIPLAIALVVDVSGSMQPGMEPLRKGLIRALPSLKAEDRAALFSFEGSSKLHVKLTHDFDKIGKKIAGFRAAGWTNINDAVYEAAKYLQEEAPQARRVVLLVSDAFPTVDGKKPVQEELLVSEAALFVIRVPLWIDDKYYHREHLTQLASMGIALDVGRLRIVDDLAAASGGLVMDVKRPEGIQPSVEHMIQMLKTRYTLGFYPNPKGTPGSVRRIDLQLKNVAIGRGMPGTILAFRNRYRVPPEPTKPSRRPREDQKQP